MTEHELLQQALTALVCALAHDEAIQHGADAAVIQELRQSWVTDAESIIDQAEHLHLWEE